MPPRLGSTRLASKGSNTCSATLSFSPRPSPPAHNTRQFSQSSSQQATLRRRKFYEWLNGPGAQLKDPLPGSTNYMGAYDKYGNLARATPGWTRKSARSATEPKKKVEVNQEEGKEKDDENKPAGQEVADDLELSVQRDEQQQQAEAAEEATSDLPPETQEDLRPFPLNSHFRSQPVLSEELREEIYQRVTRDGATVALTSVEFGVSNERVGAVVRLKQMEKEWVAQGKQLATPYSKAVLSMLPTTPYVDQTLPSNKGKRPIPHEPINDLMVHPATRQQLFVPVAESRHFTREDAAKAFDNDLLPADDRIPHPELVQAERELAQGLSLRDRQKNAAKRYQQEAEKHAKKEAAKKQEEIRSRHTVPQRRWDYVFTDISVENAGKDGRGSKGVGWRYGFPHEDRKKGQVKIPTKVEA